MDNSSKAIIMAGAILIAIAIVGVGVYIFSSTSSISQFGQRQIDTVAAYTANSVLRNYSGTGIKGSMVKEFKGYIDVYNSQNVFPTDIKISNYKFDNSISGTLVRPSDSIDNSAYYAVALRDDNGDGYYDMVQIVRQAGFLGGEASGDSGELIDLTELGEEEALSGEMETVTGEPVENEGTSGEALEESDANESADIELSSEEASDTENVESNE